MKIYLVTYDLHIKGQNYSDLLLKIKESMKWARLSESSYAVGSEKTPQQLYDYLKTSLDSNDQLYIITLMKPYKGCGIEEVNDWLANNLPSSHHW